METSDANAPLEPRFPTLDDLLFLCQCLNEAGARYLVIGGWALIHHGFERTTSDVDLLVEDSPENFQKIRTAMLKLPDGQTHRAKDALDRAFLIQLLEHKQ